MLLIIALRFYFSWLLATATSSSTLKARKRMACLLKNTLGIRNTIQIKLSNYETDDTRQTGHSKLIISLTADEEL